MIYSIYADFFFCYCLSFLLNPFQMYSVLEAYQIISACKGTVYFLFKYSYFL